MSGSSTEEGSVFGEAAIESVSDSDSDDTANAKEMSDYELIKLGGSPFAVSNINIEPRCRPIRHSLPPDKKYLRWQSRYDAIIKDARERYPLRDWRAFSLGIWMGRKNRSRFYRLVIDDFEGVCDGTQVRAYKTVKDFLKTEIGRAHV